MNRVCCYWAAIFEHWALMDAVVYFVLTKCLCLFLSFLLMLCLMSTLVSTWLSEQCCFFALYLMFTVFVGFIYNVWGFDLFSLYPAQQWWGSTMGLQMKVRFQLNLVQYTVCIVHCPFKLSIWIVESIWKHISHSYLLPQERYGHKATCRILCKKKKLWSISMMEY